MFSVERPVVYGAIPIFMLNNSGRSGSQMSLMMSTRAACEPLNITVVIPPNIRVSKWMGCFWLPGIIFVRLPFMSFLIRS